MISKLIEKLLHANDWEKYKFFFILFLSYLKVTIFSDYLI